MWAELGQGTGRTRDHMEFGDGSRQAKRLHVNDLFGMGPGQDQKDVDVNNGVEVIDVLPGRTPWAWPRT